MRLSIVIIASLMLSACALFGIGSGDLRDDWNKQQSVYNALLETAVSGRRPCIDIGPDAAGCLINDETYRKVEILRAAADGYLKAADAQLALGESSKAKFYLSSSAGALSAIAVHLGTDQP
jgi:hypothetical protein